MDYIKIVREREDDHRYNHSVSVMETAIKLAEAHHVDKEKARLAGLLHDIAKCSSKAEQKSYYFKHYSSDIPEGAYHSYNGYFVAKELGIEDEDVLNAIKNHTLGRPNMSDLEKIIYIADFIEPLREGAIYHKYYDISFVNLDLALYLIMSSIVIDLKKKNKFVPQITFDALDYYYQKTRLDLVKYIANLIDDIRLKDITIYDFENTNPFFDFTIIATATNRPMLEGALKKLTDDKALDIRKIEGRNSDWILIDFSNIIVHLMLEEDRKYYQLDILYMGLKKWKME